MIDNKTKGNAGEKIAAKYLKSIGYEILETNYRANENMGEEIDIIALDGKTLVFVEVKTRFNDKYGYAAEAVSFEKRRRINRAAAVFIKNRRFFGADVRFDVVEVYISDKNTVHIKNAFDSYLRY